MTRFATYIDSVTEALEARLVPIEGGPLDGIEMVSRDGIREALATIEVPPPDAQMAELTTPATVYLDARCHICGQSAMLTVTLESKTTVDNKHRTLAAKVDASSVVHVCGQVALPRTVGAVEGQVEGSWSIPVVDFEPDDTDGEEGIGTAPETAPEPEAKPKRTRRPRRGPSASMDPSEAPDGDVLPE